MSKRNSVDDDNGDDKKMDIAKELKQAMVTDTIGTPLCEEYIPETNMFAPRRSLASSPVKSSVRPLAYSHQLDDINLRRRKCSFFKDTQHFLYLKIIFFCCSFSKNNLCYSVSA